MSDIAIRFDGLLLAAVIAFSVLVFAIISALSLAVAAFAKTRKSYRFDLAKIAAALAGFSLICLVAVLAYMEVGSPSMSSSDWIDWIALPWTILFLLSLVWLFRLRKGENEIS
jgi:cytochrome bd-type quinol oxidase subunit 2